MNVNDQRNGEDDVSGTGTVLVLADIIGIRVKRISTSNLEAVLQQWALRDLIYDALNSSFGNREDNYFIFL